MLESVLELELVLESVLESVSELVLGLGSESVEAELLLLSLGFDACKIRSAKYPRK